METEGRDDLIVYNERAVLMCQPAYILKETRLRHDHPEVADDRLDHDSRDVVAPFLQSFLQSGGIVEWNGDDFMGDACRDTSAVWNTKRGWTRACSNEHKVGMAMIAASELDNLVATGIGAGYADRRHNGFCTGIDEADLIHRRDCFLQHYCKLDFKLGRRTIERSVSRSFSNGLRDMRMGMSSNNWAICGQVVDITVAIDIPEVGAFGLLHKYGRPAPNRFERAGGSYNFV